MAANMKIAVIRGVTLSSLVVVTNVSNPVASETSADIYHPTWQHILEDSNFHGGSFIFTCFNYPNKGKLRELPSSELLCCK
jgi:hypothetical protein